MEVHMKYTPLLTAALLSTCYCANALADCESVQLPAYGASGYAFPIEWTRAQKEDFMVAECNTLESGILTGPANCIVGLTYAGGPVIGCPYDITFVWPNETKCIDQYGFCGSTIPQ